MLTAKEVYRESIAFRQAIDEYQKKGLEMKVKPEYQAGFNKLKHDAPDALFNVFEFMTGAIQRGDFSFTEPKKSCFLLNSESYCVPILEAHGFEITDSGDENVTVSWQKGLPARAAE